MAIENIKCWVIEKHEKRTGDYIDHQKAKIYLGHIMGGKKYRLEQLIMQG